MIPLAERMRPRQLSEVSGQQHIIGEGSVLRKAIANKHIPSIIFWGPPGVGKTTLATLLAAELKRPFFQLSAISSGVKEVREIIETAKTENAAILFIDEIHRFNKGQQDALLGAVEKGIITLIGATTENPSFEVNSALLSRCQVYILKPLEREALEALLQTAIADKRGYGQFEIVLQETEALLNLSGGDARKLYNLLEIAVETALPEDQSKSLIITDKLVMDAAQLRVALYDKHGEQHYDIVSAFIKSIRGSDPNGALYWLARMIEGSEDLEFIARRLLILASEDIGNANPTALVLANTTFEAVKKIGYPESRIILAQCTIYLASSPKSNASYSGIEAALALVQKTGDLPVPLHLRNAPTHLMKKMGYGENYQYSHLGQGNFIEQEYLPNGLVGTRLYTPGPNAREEELRKFLLQRWKLKYGYGKES